MHTQTFKNYVYAHGTHLVIAYTHTGTGTRTDITYTHTPRNMQWKWLLFCFFFMSCFLLLFCFNLAVAACQGDRPSFIYVFASILCFAFCVFLLSVFSFVFAAFCLLLCVFIVLPLDCSKRSFRLKHLQRVRLECHPWQALPLPRPSFVVAVTCQRVLLRYSPLYTYVHTRMHGCSCVNVWPVHRPLSLSVGDVCAIFIGMCIPCAVRFHCGSFPLPILRLLQCSRSWAWAWAWSSHVFMFSTPACFHLHSHCAHGIRFAHTLAQTDTYADAQTDTDTDTDTYRPRSGLSVYVYCVYAAWPIVSRASPRFLPPFSLLSSCPLALLICNSKHHEMPKE